jgi:hypothetical protein
MNKEITRMNQLNCGEDSMKFNELVHLKISEKSDIAYQTISGDSEEL